MGIAKSWKDWDRSSSTILKHFVHYFFFKMSQPYLYFLLKGVTEWWSTPDTNASFLVWTPLRWRHFECPKCVRHWKFLVFVKYTPSLLKEIDLSIHPLSSWQRSNMSVNWAWFDKISIETIAFWCNGRSVFICFVPFHLAVWKICPTIIMQTVQSLPSQLFLRRNLMRTVSACRICA